MTKFHWNLQKTMQKIWRNIKILEWHRNNDVELHKFFAKQTIICRSRVWYSQKLTSKRVEYLVFLPSRAECSVNKAGRRLFCSLAFILNCRERHVHKEIYPSLQSDALNTFASHGRSKEAWKDCHLLRSINENVFCVVQRSAHRSTSCIRWYTLLLQYRIFRSELHSFVIIEHKDTLDGRFSST